MLGFLINILVYNTKIVFFNQICKDTTIFGDTSLRFMAAYWYKKRRPGFLPEAVI